MYVETVRGVGYRIASAAEELGDMNAPAIDT
jgi:hypothetical protein